MGCGASSQTAVQVTVDPDLEVYSIFPRTTVPRDSNETSALFRALRLAAAYLRNDQPPYTVGLLKTRPNRSAAPAAVGGGGDDTRSFGGAGISGSSSSSSSRASVALGTPSGSARRGSIAVRAFDTQQAKHEAINVASLNRKEPTLSALTSSKHVQSQRNVLSQTGSQRNLLAQAAANSLSPNKHQVAQVQTPRTPNQQRNGPQHESESGAHDVFPLSQRMLLLARILRHPLCFTHFNAFVHTYYPSGLVPSESGESIVVDDFSVTREAVEALVAFYIHCETVLKFGTFIPTIWNPFTSDPLDPTAPTAFATPSGSPPSSGKSPSTPGAKPSFLRGTSKLQALEEAPSPSGRQGRKESKVFTFESNGGGSSRPSRLQNTASNDFSPYSDSEPSDNEVEEKNRGAKSSPGDAHHRSEFETPTKPYELAGARKEPGGASGKSLFSDPFVGATGTISDHNLASSNQKLPLGSLMGPHLRSFQRDFISSLYSQVVLLARLLAPKELKEEIRGSEVHGDSPPMSPRGAAALRTNETSTSQASGSKRPSGGAVPPPLTLPPSMFPSASPTDIHRLQRAWLIHDAFESLLRMLRTKAAFNQGALHTKTSGKDQELILRRITPLNANILARAIRKYLVQLEQPLKDTVAYLTAPPTGIASDRQISNATQVSPGAVSRGILKTRKIDPITHMWMQKMGVFGMTGVSLSPSEATFLLPAALTSLAFVREALLTLLTLATFSDFVASPAFNVMMHALNALLKGTNELVLPVTAVGPSSSTSTSSTASQPPASTLSPQHPSTKSGSFSVSGFTSLARDTNPNLPQTISSQLLFNDAIRCAPYALFVGDWSNVTQCQPNTAAAFPTTVTEAIGNSAGHTLPTALLDGSPQSMVDPSTASSRRQTQSVRMKQLGTTATITKTVTDAAGNKITTVIGTANVSGTNTLTQEALQVAAGVSEKVAVAESGEFTPPAPRPIAFDLSRFTLNRDIIRGFVSALNWIPDSIGVFVVSMLSQSPNHLAYETHRLAQYKYDQLQRAVRGLFSENYQAGPRLSMHSRRVVLCNARFAQFTIAPSICHNGRPIWLRPSLAGLGSASSMHSSSSSSSTARASMSIPPSTPTDRRGSIAALSAALAAPSSTPNASGSNPSSGHLAGETRDGHITTMAPPSFLSGVNSGPGAGAGVASPPYALASICYRELLGREASSITIRSRDVIIHSEQDTAGTGTHTSQSNASHSPKLVVETNHEAPLDNRSRTVTEAMDKLERIYGVVTLSPATLPPGIAPTTITGSGPNEENAPNSGEVSAGSATSATAMLSDANSSSESHGHRRSVSGQLSVSRPESPSQPVREEGVPVLSDRVIIAMKPIYMRCKVGQKVPLHTPESTRPQQNAARNINSSPAKLATEDKSKASLGERFVGAIREGEYIPYTYTPLFYVGLTFPIPLIAMGSSQKPEDQVNTADDALTGISLEEERQSDLFYTSSNYANAITLSTNDISMPHPSSSSSQNSTDHRSPAPTAASSSLVAPRQIIPVSGRRGSVVAALAPSALNALSRAAPVAPTGSSDPPSGRRARGNNETDSATSSVHSRSHQGVTSLSSSRARVLMPTDLPSHQAREQASRAFAEKHQLRNMAWLNLFPDAIDVALNEV